MPSLAGKTEAAQNLLAQLVVNGVQIGRKVVAHGLAPDSGRTEIARKDGRAQALHDFLQGVQRRHGRALGRTVPDGVQGRGVAETLHHRVQFRHGHGRVVMQSAHGRYPVVFPVIHAPPPARNGFCRANGANTSGRGLKTAGKKASTHPQGMRIPADRCVEDYQQRRAYGARSVQWKTCRWA